MPAGKKPTTCPFDDASLWSRLTFWWLNPIFRIGYKKRLDSEDMYDVPKEDEARQAESRLTKFWGKEMQKRRDGHKASLFYAVLMAFKMKWLLPGILIFMLEAINMVQPFFIGQLITYFSPSSLMSDTEAYLYGVCLGGSALIQVFCNPTYFFTMQRVGMRMRTAMAGLIYRKVLTLNCKNFANTSSGKVVNLLSTDIEKLISGIELLHYLWITPITIALSAFLIYKMVGLSCAFGLSAMAVLLPFQVITGLLFGKLRLKIGAWSDKRIHVMTEILAGMRVIKMYCWEGFFSNLINYLRNKEIRFLKLSFLLRSQSNCSFEISSRLMTLLAFVGHWLAGYPPLPLQNIFMTLGWFSILRMSVLDFLYRLIESMSELASSLSRIQTFLIISEETTNETSVNNVEHHTDTDDDWVIEVTNMAASWGTRKKTTSPTEEDTALVETQAFSLRDFNLKVQKGELIAVVGTVGVGKSSLLSVLLEELPIAQGQVTMYGSVSYACQQSWVFSGTVRDNVLFGDKMDRIRYEAVLKACSLSKDISRMPYGDQTLVGERGLLLSGGQKARITLARAVYRERDIYLLDDPLSAVDTKVGKHIFNRCICEVLKGTTRVLVTHQLQYLNAADRIVVMSNGQILDVGSYEEFSSRNIDLSSLMTIPEEEDTEDLLVRDEEDMDTLSNAQQTNSAEELQAEDRYSGSVSVGVYLKYFKAGKGVFFLPVILLLWTASQSLIGYSDWLLAAWTEAIYPEAIYNSSIFVYNTSQDLVTYNYTTTHWQLSPQTRSWATMGTEMRRYILACLAYFVVTSISCLITLQMTAVASKNLHNQMFKYILGARTEFFDENPVGRVLNRFARDIGFLDTLSGRYLGSILRLFFKFLSVVVITLIVSPWLLIPITPVLLVVVVLRHYAVQTTRDVRRLEGLARSPVYSHISDTINGLPTIRAMKKEDQCYDDFVAYQNMHTSAWFIYISSYRWFSFRSNFSLALYTTVVYFACLALGNSISRGLLALALTYCSVLGEPFEYMMRTSAEFENTMTSTERIVSYTNLEQERPVTTATPPPSTWPTSGSIIFRDTCLRYSPNGALVLKHLNFEVKPKEKIGIVGRTGAGKSSLLAALLRLTEPEGTIVIDDIDITKIGLHELRHRISVIPQDPVLFTGTLRTNLDPFDEFEDNMIWTSLDQVKLRDKVTSSHGQLDMEVMESGSNFSVGQRQLICLARAFLRSNKILVLDEATANVDHRTDKLIQRTIRDKFEDCTVLTIAHRLQTVMDCDRILVLDEGQIQEFDAPYLLLQNQDGFLRHLVRQMGQEHERYLLTLAKEQRKSGVCLNISIENNEIVGKI